jgi:hypothetical protein
LPAPRPLGIFQEAGSPANRAMTNHNNNIRSTAARAFVRSLNILLKFARMYDFGHPRTAKQYEIAWSELRVALGDDETGLLLAISGDQLLLDGTPLEGSAAERSFARMLSAAGIASVHFSQKLTHASLARFVRGFPTGTGAKPGQLAEQLKAALQGDPHIHVNEVCFVPADSAVAKSTMAAHLAARTLSMNSEQTDQLLNDPEKLLQLIVAAEGARAGAKDGAGHGGPGGTENPAGTPTGTYRGGALAGTQERVAGPAVQSGAAETTSSDAGRTRFYADDSVPGVQTHGTGDGSGSVSTAGFSTVEGPAPVVRERSGGRWTQASSAIRKARPARGTPGSMAVETGLMTLHEDELQGILQVLAQIARTTNASEEKLDLGSFQSRLSTLPRRARFTVSQALSALAAQSPSESSDRPTLLKLAEHVAVRFALESYERGDIEVNAVRQMMSDMSSELDGLRKILGVYEEKMSQAGLEVQSNAEVLAQQFWSQVPGATKDAVLESGEAWCLPPVRLREHVEELKSRGEEEAVERILTNYAGCIKSNDIEARRQTAMGLAELAPLYASAGQKVLVAAIRETGVQLGEERDSQLQSLLGAALVRLSQEAANNRSYPAMQRSVEVLDYLESERAGAGKTLRTRIAMEDRLPEFIEDAVKAGSIPAGLQHFLRRLSQPAAEHVAVRFGRAGFREDCELLVSMVEGLGPDALEHLRDQLVNGNQVEAIDTVGILCRLDLKTVERVLPDRMHKWKRTAHDRVVRQIASSGSPERGRLLLQLFDVLDPMIRPLAIDEIGMSGEKLADMRLLRIAEGDLPDEATDFLRLKAIEALGRLRTAGAEAVLRKVAEARKAWRWAYASELRMTAAQSLEKIDAEWARYFIPQSGLNVAEFAIEFLDNDPTSSALRQRRYPRMRLEHPVPGTAVNPKEHLSVHVPEIGLGGGVVSCEQGLHPGSIVELRLSASQRPVKAQTIVRDANTKARAFEVVDMELTERAKLRKLLVQLGSGQKAVTVQERSRRGTRTIVSGG